MLQDKGRFGKYGGQFVPETVMSALAELEESYKDFKQDYAYTKELKYQLEKFAGRPTRLYHAKRLTDYYGKAEIYLKREDLLHTGAHKINNALGQALLAKYMGKKRMPKPGLDSMGLPQLQYALCLGLAVQFIWERKIAASGA